MPYTNFDTKALTKPNTPLMHIENECIHSINNNNNMFL